MNKKKNIVLGVTGGIAAYKACELTRLLVKGDFSVHVIMTENAKEFVTPLTFSTLSGNPVALDMFDRGESERIRHIDLADSAGLVIIAPATANIIGKVLCGIADDLLSTVIMANSLKGDKGKGKGAPVLFCPAMNVNMYENPIVQENIKKLRDLGYKFVEPGEGFLACGWEGKGRMAEPDDIYDFALDLLTEKDLSGIKFLVTAGPTREAIDSVRFISNYSTGKMGFAIARRVSARGGDVVLITGPTHHTPPIGIETISVNSAKEMAKEVKEKFPEVDVVIKAAAVSDLTPKRSSAKKLKKENCGDVLELDRTEDILKGLGDNKGDKILVGFAAESHDLTANAKEKLKRKNLDIIVANDISRTDSGFGTDSNIVRIIWRNGKEEALPLMTKEEVGDRILDHIKDIWQEKRR